MFLTIGDNIERPKLPVMPIVLIVANTLVLYVEMRVGTSGPGGKEGLQTLVATWGLVPRDLADGHVVGLLTSLFLHDSFVHLLGNMLVLWAFACSLEIGLGCGPLLAGYLLCGSAAGVTHAAMHPASGVPLIGASGAVAGLIGMYVVHYGPLSGVRTVLFLMVRLVEVQVPAALFGLVWCGWQVWSAVSDPQGLSGVAWHAHLGGFAAGCVIALLWQQADAGRARHRHRRADGGQAACRGIDPEHGDVVAGHVRA
jgi:membrane associated rhomboid family serine protease